MSSFFSCQVLQLDSLGHPMVVTVARTSAGTDFSFFAKFVKKTHRKSQLHDLSSRRNWSVKSLIKQNNLFRRNISGSQRVFSLVVRANCQPSLNHSGKWNLMLHLSISQHNMKNHFYNHKQQQNIELLFHRLYYQKDLFLKHTISACFLFYFLNLFFKTPSVQFSFVGQNDVFLFLLLCLRECWAKRKKRKKRQKRES